LYEKEKNRLNGMIAIATKEIDEINNKERDMEVEFESFMSILQKAPELFRKKSYKAKSILTDIFIDKIIPDFKIVCVSSYSGSISLLPD
jgi:hypothetical protein